MTKNPKIEKKNSAKGKTCEGISSKALLKGGGVSRFKCVCAYDGTDFRGWQSQACGGGVQDLIELQLEKIFREKIRVHASGRTDAGVHAVAQVFHFDANWSHSTDKLLSALKCGLRDTVQLSSLSKVSSTFHARYGAKKKRYVYKMHLAYAPPHLTRYMHSLEGRVPDVDAMNSAARILIGKRDFTAFSVSRHAPKENPVKNLISLKVSKKCRELKITSEASGYLYKMMRMLAGALLAVGLGKLSEKELEEILKSAKRHNKFAPLPPKGLFLEKVFY